MHPGQQKIIAALENALAVNDDYEAWSLEEVLKRLLARDEETISKLAGKNIVAHDQYGQKGKAILAFSADNEIIITTEDDLV